ncbi:MAG: TetR/AcrR family transcriptional regulator [Rhodobacteraceae bacterium]|nr:TetR/AcrR family transcriptional regulator [Paracoccaceae bacterium]
MNQTLRQKQKASRHARILKVARRRFQAEGYSNVTIEEIARESELSPATVYNYFNSKVGILLALVGESDEILLAELDAMFAAHRGSLSSAILDFGRTLRRHAMSYLQKPTWREVLSASIQDGSGEFGRTYTALDRVIIGKIADKIRSMQRQDQVSAAVNADDLADCLFSLQNIRFFQFIADDAVSLEMADDALRRDLDQLEHLFRPTD